MKKITALILLGLMLVASVTELSSCDDSGGDGGKCKYCGTHTNWTYKGGGYICWICDH